ncbi:zinc-dependent metalloprotease [Flavisolibacter sp. BT320]|nr:zinc-dependent metalloprotease [Flavisolibacter longurius]
MKKYGSLLLLQLFALLLCAQQSPAPAAKKTKSAATAKADSAKAGPLKEWKDVLKDTREIKGLITMHLKRDNTLYFELDPKDLDKDLGMSLHYSKGPSEMVPTGIPAVWDTRLIRFRRYGDQVALVHYNERYTAAEGSTMKTTLETGIGHSILAMFKVESEHKETKHILVDVTPFFTSDYVNDAQNLKFFFDNKPLQYEKEKSFVERARAFELNNEIDATVSFRSAEYPSNPIDVMADSRFLSIGVRYSLFALPKEPMKPRLADDRVGHFLTALRDYAKDKEDVPYLRYVNRWRLEKKDPTEALSEPVKPIVFYLHNSIPVEYRRYVREGIEAWNKAFLKAGFLNAIIAKEQPDDSTWSAEDMRYSTIRWIPDPGGWAIGPSEVDPRTGEILNADILIASGITNWYHQEYQSFSGPNSMLAKMERAETAQQRLPPSQAQRLCMAQVGLEQQLKFQGIVLEALGLIGPGSLTPEKYIGDALRDLVMHEVGHTLGLRHNFKGSSAIPYEKLQDTVFTRQHGLTLSVMDYAPVNVSPDPQKQGHYWNAEVGEYDVWAIAYAYEPVPAKTSAVVLAANAGKEEVTEQSLLKKIASQGNAPLHAYGTDEDNWLGPYAVDPNTNAWELGSDLAQFARDRQQILQTVTPLLEYRLIRSGDDYNRLRNAFTTLSFVKFQAVVPLVKTIGGLHYSRNHKGDPEERMPFTPVPAAKQREAMDMIVKTMFAEDAFSAPPDLLNKLAPNRYSHWGVGWGSTPVDYPLLENANQLQTYMLDNLLHPVKLQRMLNNELRVGAGEATYLPAEMLQSLTGSIWSELKAPQLKVTAMRRNLQNSYVNTLVRLFTEMPGYMVWDNGRMTEARVPAQVRSLARLELAELAALMQKALKAGTPDRDLKAHLEYNLGRVDKILNAGYQLPLK